MQLEEFRAAVRAKAADLVLADTKPESCENAITEIVNDALRLRPGPQGGATAVDPNFWLVIIQTLVPIFLEWINRRFPRPSPTPTPNP